MIILYLQDPNSSTELLKIMLKIKDDNKTKEEDPSPIKYTNFEKTDTSTPKKISIEELFKVCSKIIETGK